jgi:predicted RNase H-like HicB family nuclease
MMKGKLVANGPPEAFGIEVQPQPDGSFLGRVKDLPGLYMQGATLEQLAHRVASVVSLLTVAAKMTGTTLDALWNEKEGLLEVEVLGEIKNGQATFTGGKAGNA